MNYELTWAIGIDVDGLDRQFSFTAENFTRLVSKYIGCNEVDRISFLMNDEWYELWVTDDEELENIPINVSAWGLHSQFNEYDCIVGNVLITKAATNEVPLGLTEKELKALKIKIYTLIEYYYQGGKYELLY